ncbi:hypothetical protein VFPFJ_05451 [Purpureocillium lilacinum]|uniref:WHIM1 domain-containing protein n=1 Tax=Purpureocillium lilacinum TaxID=33203 RepID=A0A179HN40_PURLI|nr:hypothetical protein VFPFJ_05451 [Purpureocillium lilacinum]OAQ84507.1 hypothetical protein VFPBJ_03275 [Purpureocillium lilacinum]OAQ91292.1 hypothetical protein VFPFJ_05451 [Purpureocillium lilacinum]GJN68778.1 hypothetical protein PLICBS_002822 [Purpureocillium lilacinum]GJN77545.1 hypothetical protein PLIIFM63780_001037 [Purpureocillium lilacinum]
MAAADDDSSDLSSLSSLSPAPSDDEMDAGADAAKPKGRKSGILKFFPKLSEQAPKEPSPPPRKRSPSPPHEYVLADNPDIAFIVMFRNRFNDAFPKSLAHFGPQELERDIVESIPGDRVEHFLCAVLGLLLNRKQDVKPGHYGRALEDAIAGNRNQWPAAWEDKSPLSGNATFNSMIPTERLTLLRTLILWAMASSDALKALINQSYKQNRHEDDLNQPRAVQPWGSDGDKRRYFLVEGQDDTHFRVYRESNPAGTNRTWWSVAGSIDELKALAEKLDTKDGGPKARKLSHKILQVIPRFEAGEEKRKRREYRQMRKEQFKRPEPGFSLYEGRTRGKRIKYTYSDDEDMYSDSTGYRRSARNTGTTTPAETGPVTTSSGRQIRAPPRLNMVAGDSAPGSVHGDGSEADRDTSAGPSGRPRRSAAAQRGMNSWDEGQSQRPSAGTDDEESEAEFGDDEEDAHVPEESEDEDEFDDDEAMVEDDLDDHPQSLVVKLSVTPPKLRTALAPVGQATAMLPTPEAQDWKSNVSTPRGPAVGMEESPVQDSISVAAGTVKEVTDASPLPAEAERQATPPLSDQRFELQRPNTNGSMAAASLAFRGSPEKPQTQPLPPAVVNMAGQE